MKNQSNNINEHPSNILGWCMYCKESINVDEDYLKKSGQLYHVECWKQKNDVIEELDF